MVIFCESIISNQGKEDSHIQEKGSVGDMVGRVSSLSTEARICEPPPSEHCTVECGVAFFTRCQSRIRHLVHVHGLTIWFQVFKGVSFLHPDFVFNTCYKVHDRLQ